MENTTTATTITEAEYLKTFKSDKQKLLSKYLMTPEMAKYILEHHNKENRKISKKHVRYFEKLIKSNRFEAEGRIEFDVNGDLGDGQHRNTAIVNCNIPTYVTVIVGTSVKNRSLPNKVRAQSKRDDIQMHRTKMESKTSNLDSTKLGEFYSAVAHIFNLKSTNETVGNEEYDSYELNEFLENNWDAVFNRIYGEENLRNVTKPTYMYNPALMYAIEYLIWERETIENKEKVHEFFDLLWCGGEKAFKPTTPTAVYIDFIKGLKNRTGAKGYKNVINGIYNAWIAYKNNETVKNGLQIVEVPDFRAK